MSPSLRSSSLSMLAVSYIIPLTMALPANLQIQHNAKLPEILSFVPSCARNCVSAEIAPMNCVDGWVEGCLCGDSPQSFKDSLWQCIDEGCGGEKSSFHQAVAAKVEGICKVLVSTASTTKSTQSATEISARSGSKPFVQESSTTTEAFVPPSVEATVSTSGTVPTSTGAGSKTSNEEKKRAGLSTPAIIGISIGSFFLFAAVVGSFVYYAVTRERKGQKKQIQSITFEPNSCDGAAVDGKTDRGALGSGIWMSISSSSTLTSGYHSSNQPIPPIDTSVANEKPNAHPIPLVNPTAPQGFEFGETLQQRGIVVKSQKIIENPHLFLPPVITHTPASPIGGMASPILALVPGNGDLPGTVISTDIPMGNPMPLNNLPMSRSTIATAEYPTDLLSSSPESSKSTRSFLRSSHSPLAADISRSDTLSWRRVVDEAAGRAVTRVLHSEQSVNEEMDTARRRKSRFLRRLSRDSRADEESLAGGERLKGGQISPLMSKRSNSDSTNSRGPKGDREERRDN